VKGRYRSASRHNVASQLGVEADQGLGSDLRGESKLWSMYAKESTEYDKAMLKGWNDALDVLLIMVSKIVYDAFMFGAQKFA
jgi:Family of unknown function (DUF6535)